MTIAVVGGSGFLGRHVVQVLTENSFPVVNIDRAVPPEALAGERHISCDLRAADFPHSILGELGDVSAVVWLAATIRHASTVDESADDDIRIMVGTPLSLLASLSSPPKAFVYISSIQVYGRPQYLPVDEEHPTNPFTAYGVAKLCGEKYLHIASTKRGVRFVSLRVAFIYGPGQHSSNVIPKFLQAVAQRQSPVLFGGGEEVRDDVYVGDVAKAVMGSIRNERCSGPYNIASGRPHSLLSVARDVCEIAGSEQAPTVLGNESAWVDRWYSVERAKRDMNYSSIDFKDGLKLTWQHLCKQA